MADRLAGLIRYMWPVRGSASARCMPSAEDGNRHENCHWAADRLNYETACAKARARTRETGHDTRVRHERIVEYSRSEEVPRA